MTKTKQAVNLESMTIDDVAGMLFVSDRTIRNWLKEKEMPSSSDTRGRRFKWADVLPWYVDMRSEDSGNQRKSAFPSQLPTVPEVVKPPESFDDALRRKTVAEADLKELDLATRRGQVVAVEDVARVMQDTAKNLQVKILGWPTLMIGQIFGMRDRNRLFDMLSRSARDLCKELASLEGAATAARESDG